MPGLPILIHNPYWEATTKGTPCITQMEILKEDHVGVTFLRESPLRVFKGKGEDYL